jgi:hypothetical protein
VGCAATLVVGGEPEVCQFTRSDGEVIVTWLAAGLAAAALVTWHILSHRRT